MTHACQSTQVFQGYAQNDHIGWDVAFGDWDDDGTPDLLAGHASKYDEIVFGQPEPGADPDPVILYMGPFVDEVRTFSPSGSDLRVVGEQLNDTFGHAVTFVGNLELASLYEDPPVPVSPEQAPDDFVVGAPRATQQPPFGTENWPEQGKVYVFLSGLFRDSFGQPLTGLQSASDASLIIEGEAPRHRLGYSICPAGDFDGDGYPDFAVSAPWGGAGWDRRSLPSRARSTSSRASWWSRKRWTSSSKDSTPASRSSRSPTWC